MTESSGDSGSASELITRFETVLRELIRSVLGRDWHQGTGVDLEKLRAKREYERGRRRGVVVPDDLLVFTEHLELAKIINKHWEKFAGILGDKKRWTVYTDRIAAIRNAPMHGRHLLKFERQLLAGMTGEISNIVAQHRSSQSPDSAWYPVIESITDSFGNEVPLAHASRLPTRLSVGETIYLRCVGRDPQERQLTWTLTRFAPTSRQLDQKVGAQVELAWTVEPEDVSEQAQIIVNLVSDGEYHRNGHNDAAIFTSYAVNPPYEVGSPGASDSA